MRDEITSLPQAALRWALDQGHVSLALTGAKNTDELRDCALAAEAEPYSDKELMKVKPSTRRTFPRPEHLGRLKDPFSWQT